MYFQDILKDLKKLVENSTPWAAFHLVKGVNYFKIVNDIDITNVIDKLKEATREPEGLGKEG